MQAIEIKKKCQGEIHRVRIRIMNGEVDVSCPDHDFDLDETQEALEGLPISKNFCIGVYTGWSGIRDVTLSQVEACINGARSHGLTSKIARKIFGTQTAELLYRGIRSPNFARQLLDSLVWPTAVPFDLTAAERFINSQPESAKLNFAVAATAGGIGFDKSDLDWLDYEGIDLKFAVDNLYEPSMWRLMRDGNTREELNDWWRAARILLPQGYGRLVLNLVATLPLPLTNLDLVPVDQLEAMTAVRQTHRLMLVHQLITTFNIRDAITLAAIIEAKLTLDDFSISSKHKIQHQLQQLVRSWKRQHLTI